MKQSRQNDVALALGAVALCTAIGLAGYMRGWVVLGGEQQKLVDIIARLRTTAGYPVIPESLSKEEFGIIVQKAIGTKDGQFLIQYFFRAEPTAMVIVGSILCCIGISITVINAVKPSLPSDTQSLQKGRWATGVPFLATICFIAGSATIVWGAGIFTYAYEGAFTYAYGGKVVPLSGTAIETLTISAGVIGAVSLACFIADYALNHDLLSRV